MRGADVKQAAMFSYISPEQRVPADHPLRKVREITDRLLNELSGLFEQMYSKMGRPSIAPEKLLRALLLQVLYTIRSERMLIEPLDYNLLFRWFVGLNRDDAVWVPTVFTRNRDRLLKAEVARQFFDLVVDEARKLDLMSDEHFTVDGTLREACAGLKSFKRTDELRQRRRTIRAMRRWTSTARNAVTKRIRRRPTRRRCWRARGQVRKRS
jgi:transposase